MVRAVVLAAAALAATTCGVCAFAVAPATTAASRGAFLGAKPASWAAPVSQGTTTSMALKGLAKKAKVTEVAQAKEALQASQPDSPVFALLKQGQEGASAKARPTVVSDVLRKKSGTLSVVAEYRRNLRSGFIDSMLDPEIISPMFRDGGASMVAVALDKASGGCTEADVKAIQAEQAVAKDDFPGSLPVIIRDLVVDEFQIAYAKSLDAVGVTVPVGLVGAERATELVDFAGALGIEVIVQANNKEDVEAAVALGATTIAITGNQPLEAVDLKPLIPDSTLSIVHVDRRSDEGLDEIEDCWVLRDSGFNCIWASEVLYKAGQMQAESVIAVIKAIRAKASTLYGRARGMSGKGEGAKEFLATLAT